MEKAPYKGDWTRDFLFEHEKALCKGISLLKRLLQKDFLIEKALCKGISFLESKLMEIVRKFM
jgi:hypothetical protein